MFNKKFQKACKGLSKSRGGMNLSELKEMARKKGLGNLKSRQELIEALCKKNHQPKTPSLRQVDYPDAETFQYEKDKVAVSYPSTETFQSEKDKVSNIAGNKKCNKISKSEYEQDWYNRSSLNSVNDRPSRICYYESGKVKLKEWHSTFSIHREGDLPARIEYYESGKVKLEEWYIRSSLRRKGGLPARIEYDETGKIKNKE